MNIVVQTQEQYVLLKFTVGTEVLLFHAQFIMTKNNRFYEISSREILNFVSRLTTLNEREFGEQNIAKFI